MHSAPTTPLYLRLTGPAWADLSEPVRQFHSIADGWRGIGRFTISRGSRLPARLLAWLLRLPAAGTEVPTRLEVTPRRDGERWHRTFGGRPFVTVQREMAGQVLAEEHGLIEMRFRLEVSDHALCYHQIGTALRLGPLRVRLPRWLSPQITGREWALAGEPGVRAAVRVTVPLVGLLIAYEGSIEKEE